MTGDRFWTNTELVRKALLPFSSDDTVIHGVAKGLDTIAARTALLYRMRIDLPPTPTNELGGYPADWIRYRKAAGPIRNWEMIRRGQPDMVYAFHDHIEESKGTRDCIKQAMRAGLSVHLFTQTKCYTVVGINGDIKLPVHEFFAVIAWVVVITIVLFFVFSLWSKTRA